MFCTKCGIEMPEREKFCSQCGTSATGQPYRKTEQQLSRTTANCKIAGVCGGFARYFDVDVTLVRVLWVVMTVWPIPSVGVLAYIVAWIVMPKDPLPVTSPVRP